MEVIDITFSPDSDYLFAACRGAVVAWQVINEQLQLVAIEQYNVEQDEECVIALAQSYECFAIAKKKHVTLHWKPGNEIDKARSRLSRNLTSEEWQQYLGDES